MRRTSYLLLAALLAVGVTSAQTPAPPRNWTWEADVGVIGSGATGLPAAIAPRQTGASVIVVEARKGPALGFTEWITAGVAALASLAIIWEALPAIMVSACV